jgi:hypothetical protein
MHYPAPVGAHQHFAFAETPQQQAERGQAGRARTRRPAHTATARLPLEKREIIHSLRCYTHPQTFSPPLAPEATDNTIVPTSGQWKHHLLPSPAHLSHVAIDSSMLQ